MSTRAPRGVSTSFVESTVNQVVSHGQEATDALVPQGAHLFLQVRIQVLNDDLATDFARWYSGFSHQSEPIELVA